MKKGILLLLTLLLTLQIPAFGAVYTTPKTEGMGDCVYLAGDPDNYPFEYYDADEERYCGIIPDLLQKISDGTGADFVYINGDGTDKELLGKNLQVEGVSSAQDDPTLPYYKAYVNLLEYQQEGITKRIGLVFTTRASDQLIASVAAMATAIPAAEKNGLSLTYAHTEEPADYRWLLVSLGLCVLLLVVIVLLQQRMRRIKERSYADKMTDGDTGLGNLQGFKHFFRHTITDVARPLYYLVYVILDSSYLRSYHGESSFEEALHHTALVFGETLKGEDYSARITESGFALALQAPNEEEALHHLEEIMLRLNRLEEVQQRNNKMVFHAAIYHLDSKDKNCEILLFNLRKNCNRIIGTDRQFVYCDVHAMNRIQEEKKMTESILDGFEQNEFKMYLQFIVDNKTKKIVSAEALSRWDSPSKGLIGPGKYIGNMERSGLISKHDFYMFDLACRQLEAWRSTDFEDLSISCNFTRITVSEEHFIDKLKMIADGYRFDKSKLAIEITEDAIEKDRDVATHNMMLCKELGFRVYLDDLGSGYTSLANLCDYPIDVVKIDRDILLKAEKERGRELLHGIISLAHRLNIRAICEGVETEEQNALVSASDCDLVQGWYYAKALPQEECETFLRKYEAERNHQ